MEKKILLEINRMREIMGMNLIVEATSPIIDVLIRSIEKVFEKTEDKEMQTALTKYGDASGNVLEKRLNVIANNGKKGAEKKIEAKLAIASLAAQLTESELMNMFMKIPRTEWESLGVMTSEELAEIYLVNFRNRGVYDRINNNILSIQTQDGFNKYVKQLATNLKVTEELATEIVGQFNRDVYDKFVTSQFEGEAIKTTAQLASETLSTLSQEQKQYYLEFLSKINDKTAYSKFLKETAASLKVSEEVVDEMFISISPNAVKFTERFGGVAIQTPIEKFAKGEIDIEEYLNVMVPGAYKGTALKEIDRVRIERMFTNPESRKKFIDDVINKYKSMDYDKQVEELVKLTKNQSYWPPSWRKVGFFIRNHREIISDFCVTGTYKATSKTGLFGLYGTPQEIEKNSVRDICTLIKIYAINMIVANLFKLYVDDKNATDNLLNRILNIYFQISTWNTAFEDLFKCATKEQIDSYILQNGKDWKEGTDYYLRPGICDDPQLILIQGQGTDDKGNPLKPKLMSVQNVDGVMEPTPYEETNLEQFKGNLENWEKKFKEGIEKGKEEIKKGAENFEKEVEKAEDKLNINKNQNSSNKSSTGSSGGLGTGTGPG
jgi:hypothetical protein